MYSKTDCWIWGRKGAEQTDMKIFTTTLAENS